MVLIPWSAERRAEMEAYLEEINQEGGDDQLPPYPDNVQLVPLSQWKLPINLNGDFGQSRSPSPAPARQPPDLSTIGLNWPPPVSASAPIPAPASAPTNEAQSQQLAITDDQDEEVEPLVLPVNNEVTVVKQFMTMVIRETSFSRPDAEDDGNFEIEKIGGIGRGNNNRVMLCVKWRGYPWNEGTWEPISSIPEGIKADLITVWGPLGRIRAATQPLQGQDDEDADVRAAMPVQKRAKLG